MFMFDEYSSNQATLKQHQVTEQIAMLRPGPHDLVELVLLCSRNELQITPPGVEATETYM